MKKLVIACFAVLSLAACKQGKTNGEPQLNDSLQQIIQQRDNQLNDMMATMNEIQDGFRQINEAENHVKTVKVPISLSRLKRTSSSSLNAWKKTVLC